MEINTDRPLDHQQHLRIFHPCMNLLRFQVSPSTLVFYAVTFFVGATLGIVTNFKLQISLNPVFFDQSIFKEEMTGELKHWIRPSILMHNMTDEELLWRASLSPKVTQYPYRRVPKVAFLFLTRGPLPFAPLWERFFEGNDGRYSIYVHPHPSYVDESFRNDSVFHGRRIPSKEVSWGKFSVLEAERRLLANALLDFSNERFILLSESCIPLFPFNTTYSYLINSSLSFVNVVDDRSKNGGGRYSGRLKPEVNKRQWRKGSQWFDMDRRLAVEVVSDQKYYKAFSRGCGRRWCYTDEHYIPTLVNIEFGGWSANRSVTWVNFVGKSAHPLVFSRQRVTVESLRHIRDGSKCMYNGKETSVCYLFARKFSPDALWRLQKFAPKVLGF